MLRLTNELDVASNKCSSLEGLLAEAHAREEDILLKGAAAEDAAEDAKREVVELKECIELLKEQGDASSSALEMKDASLRSMEESSCGLISRLSDLQREKEVIQIENERLSLQLQNEMAQVESRKKKIKTYIDSLTKEKEELTDRLMLLQESATNYNKELADKLKTLNEREDTITHLQQKCMEAESKHSLTLASVHETYASQVSSYQQEIFKLNEAMSNQKEVIEQELLNAIREKAESAQEMEEHKTKRLAARTETIQVAQALETAQRECLELNNYLRYTLMPMVFEEITGIETALASLEMAIARLSSKKITKLKVRAGLVSGDNRNTVASTVSNSIHQLSSTHTGFPSQSSHGKGGKSTQCSIVAGAVQQADQLKLELERAKTGIELINHSVERLMDAVHKDSLCCGGVCDGLWRLLHLSSGSASSGDSAGGYASVELSEFETGGLSSNMLDVSPRK